MNKSVNIVVTSASPPEHSSMMRRTAEAQLRDSAARGRQTGALLFVS